MYTILITGAGRGIGRYLLEAFAVRPDTTVIAAVRDPAVASRELAAFSKSLGAGSRLIFVKIDSGSRTDALEAVKELKAQGVSELNVVIANSAISEAYEPLAQVDVAAVEKHLAINTLGPLLLFQALRPLLRPQAKFLIMSSLSGSITINVAPMPMSAYSISKAATNMLGSRLHVENPDLTVFVLHPGWLKTEMGLSGLPHFGLEEIPKEYAIPLEVSISGIVKVVDDATRESAGGKFLDYKGDVLPW